MSYNKGHVRSKSTGFERSEPNGLDPNEYKSKGLSATDALPNILPEVSI